MAGSPRRLSKAFAAAHGHTGLIPYLTAGYPSIERSLDLARGFVRAGALALEIGIPFSDPIADGPDIQRASEWALREKVGARESLDLVATLRRESEIPIVIMTYANPVLRVGLERFGKAALAAGVDGVLVSDLPPDESPESWRALDEAGLDTIVLIAPTTSDERLPQLLARARGFVYCLARTGVTGRGGGEAGALDQRIAAIRRHTSLPVAVGFGVSNAEDARRLRGLADAVVVGAAFMRAIGEDPEHGAIERATRLAEGFVEALA